MLAGMLLLGRVPVRPLSDYVGLLWYAEAWQPPHARERHMPDGSVNIIIPLDGGPGMVTGARSRSIVLHTARPITVIGVHFKRGGASPFLDVPVSELSDLSAALPDVCGVTSRPLRDRLLEEPGAERRLDLLERWLAARLVQRSRSPDPAILWAVRELEGRPHVQVRAVAAHIGRSARWFINRFAAEVGLTPKVFGRVQRFQRALRHMHRSARPDLATLAVSVGYFDQAHLAHDFRSIAGLTPSDYLASRTEHINHVSIRDARA
jgi:AraC-like DNA-binding protein